MLDLYKLNKEINVFRAEHNYDPYIVCSDETQNVFPGIELCQTYEEVNSYIGMYKGYKVLTDNTLPFGEVKVR